MLFVLITSKLLLYLFISTQNWKDSAHAREEPSPPPPAAPPSPSFLSPSPSFFSALSLLLLAAFASAAPAFALASAAPALASAAPAFASVAEGLASAFAGFDEVYAALEPVAYVAEALMAAYIYASSSSAPYSNKKFAAISSFLSHAKKASAARAFGNPRVTRRSIDAISSGVTYIDPGGGLLCPPAPAPPGIPPARAPPIPAIGSCPIISCIRMPGFCYIA